ncbi:MAG TPA: hypothetical protein VNJ01_03360 [Bacteriovoracaceae bacterium]|nr:hypothetical protein [Bacteriovoracaceae bacterium]
MKILFLMISLTVCASAFAEELRVEFDHSEERACHAELKAAGCVSQTDEEVVDCAQEKKAEFSPTCQSILIAKSKE